MIHGMCLSIQVKEAEIGRSMVLFNGLPNLAIYKIRLGYLPSFVIT
jgi:hypothetical protein